MNLNGIAYVPQLKWKAGERSAVAFLNDNLRSRLLPLFRLCPPGSFESDLGVQLDEGQFLKKFGKHLTEVCGRLPALIDGELLGDGSPDQSLAHPFHQLLTRAFLEGATPVPAFRPESSSEYKSAVRRYLEWGESKRACVRVGLFDLEALDSRSSLIEFASDVGASAADSVLLIDAGPLDISDDEGLAHLIAYQFSRLIRDQDWSLVVFSSTTYPKNPGLKKWQSGSFERGDWLLYRQLERLRSELPVMPVFSDYALEFPGNYKPAPVSPSAHLRYSTENKYFIFKGTSVREEDNYRNIFRVADALLGSGIFKGSDFSQGDAFVAQLAEERDKTGHASKWRWSSTDHHLTLVMKQLNSLLGLGIADRIPQVEPDQLQLILP